MASSCCLYCCVGASFAAFIGCTTGPSVAKRYSLLRPLCADETETVEAGSGGGDGKMFKAYG